MTRTALGTAFLLVLFVTGCGADSSARQATRLPSGYWQLGADLGLVQSRRKSLLDQVAYPAGGEVGSVFVPLRGTRGPMRFLGDGWVTDERSVWCGKLEPEGKLSEWHPLARPLYAMGKTLRFGCATATLRDENQNPVIVVASEVRVLHCRTLQYRGEYYVQANMDVNWASIYESGRVVGFAKLPVNSAFRMSPTSCEGWDLTNMYQILPGNNPTLRGWQHAGLRAGGAWNITWKSDGKQVLVGGKPVKGVDPQTYTMINSDVPCPYGYDDRNVFFGSEVIAGADVASLVVINNENKRPCYAYDKSSRYRDGERLRADEVAAFEMVLHRAEETERQFQGAQVLVGPGHPRFLGDWTPVTKVR